MISETGDAVAPMETSWLAETRSELVLPLISRIISRTSSCRTCPTSYVPPLAMISGYADMLNAGHLGELNVEQQDVVKVIQHYAQVLAELISDIIAVLEIRARRSSTTRAALSGSLCPFL